MSFGFSNHPTQKPPPGAVIDDTHPDSVGLVHVYLFNEFGSNILTDIVSGRSLTVNGTAAWANGQNLTTSHAAASPPSGGPYMNLEQTVNATPAKYLRSNAGIFTALNGANELTLEVLWYMEDQSDWNVVCGNAAVDSGGAQFLFHCSSNTNIQGFKVVGVGGAHDWPAGNAPLRRWTTMHGTYNAHKSASAGKFYQDGIYLSGADTTGQVGALATTANNFNVGGDGQMNRSFGGYVARIIIWRRELSQSEILKRLVEPYAFVGEYYPGLLSIWTPPTLRLVPQYAALGLNPVRQVPQFMLIFPDDLRVVPQTMALQPIPRSIPQGMKVGGIKRLVPQFMTIATETIRHVPQHVALSPFIRSVPQHMQISPANMRSITQQMRLGITLSRSITQNMLPDYGGTTQTPRSVPQTAVLKLKGSHKPPKTNNRDIPQFLLASPKPRGVPQSGAISKVGITRFVLQAMTISLSAGVRSVPQHGAAGSVGTIRSVLQSVAAKSTGTIRSVPQFALMNTVAGRFERPVPQAALMQEPGTIRSVPQFMVTDRTEPLGRTVLQQVVALEKLVRSITQDATVAEVFVRSVPEHAVLKATNIRSVPQHMQAGGTTVSQRGIPVVSIGKIPVVVVPSEPEVELSIK